jgi:hypothetical protein
MIIKGYAYAWLTLGFFLVSLGLHWWFGWSAFVDEAREHGQSPEVGQYLTQMSRDTFENWQSEFLQVFVFIVLTTFLVHRHSHESPDTDYENEAALRRIEAKLDALEKKVTTK